MIRFPHFSELFSHSKNYSSTSYVPGINDVSRQAYKKTTSKRKMSTDLPTEILVKIFAYFAVRERKALKLVCRQWNDIFCSTPKFLRAEKFICCDLHGSCRTDILQTILHSQRKILNVEFLYFEFLSEDSAFWQQCGSKIRVLHFSECRLHSDVILDVISYCPNLEHLSWSSEKMRLENVRFCSPQTMDILLFRRIFNKNLTSLDLHFSRPGGLSNFVLNGLFIVFPNVKTFSLWYTAVEEFENEDSVINSRSCFTFQCVLNKIRSVADSMEKLNITLRNTNQRTNISWDQFITIPSLKKLKEVTLDVNLDHIEKDVVFSFFAAQLNLESLKLRGILGSLERFFSELCIHLLEFCPKLRNIWVQSRAIFLSAVCLNKIVDSRLKSLCIHTPKLKIHSDFYCVENRILVNDRLQTLVLDGDIEVDVQILFLRLFRQLRFLELYGISDDVLQVIWNYQINLVSLTLLDLSCTSDFGYAGIENYDMNVNRTHSIRRLTELEYLKIQANGDWPITQRTLDEFIFPKLRYFIVDVDIKTEFHNTFVDIISNMESLEALSLKNIAVSFVKCRVLCRKLKKLRYLDIQYDSQDGRKYTDIQCRQLFKSRSTLRAFMQKICCRNQSYFYRVLDKSVVKKTVSRFYRLHSEKIGIFFIDCLWF